jgi:hypothetical protein
MRGQLTILFALCLCACRAKIPEKWAKLGMPVENLEAVRDETNDDLFSADYRGLTFEQLATRIEDGLGRSGYKKVCSQFDGRVRGYTNQSESLLAKVDLIGPVAWLTIGNKRRADRMLYGVCFEGYQLGEPIRLK